MTRRKFTLMLVLAATVLLATFTALGRPRPTPPPAGRVFQYKVADLFSPQPESREEEKARLEKVLNDYGKEGWEFVARDGEYRLYFKK